MEHDEEPDERFFSGDPATVVAHLVEAARAAGWTLQTVEDDGRRLVWVDQGDPSPGRAVLEAVLTPDPEHGCLVRLSETYAGPDASPAPVPAT